MCSAFSVISSLIIMNICAATEPFPPSFVHESNIGKYLFPQLLNTTHDVYSGQVNVMDSQAIISFKPSTTRRTLLIEFYHQKVTCTSLLLIYLLGNSYPDLQPPSVSMSESYPKPSTAPGGSPAHTYLRSQPRACRRLINGGGWLWNGR